MSASLPVAGAVLGAPETGQAAVMFHPSSTPSQLALAAASAGVEIVRFGAAPGAVIVNIETAAGHAALREAGAWLIADPVILGGCTAQPLKELRS